MVTHFVSVQRDSSELIALREGLRAQLDRVKRKAETSKLLPQVSRLLSSYSSMSDVADVIAEGIQVVTAADRTAVALWDASSGRLRFTAPSGWPTHLADKVAAVTLSAADLPELAVFAASKPAVMVGADASPPMQHLLTVFEVAAFAAMPISSHGKLRGQRHRRPGPRVEAAG